MEKTILFKEKIKFVLVDSLVQWRKWGDAYTQHFFEGLPFDTRVAEETKQASEELQQFGWLFFLKKEGKVYYSLNPEKLQAISLFYENNKKQQTGDN